MTKTTKLEPVTRTYCNGCGDECTRTIVNVGERSYCTKNSCRNIEWNLLVLMGRVKSDIKEQGYF